jgi:Na+-driven multidrug efflux pump
VILSGTFRALGEMTKFGKFNFITYFVIILGLSIYLCIFTGEHVLLDDGVTTHKKGYGPMGTWYAFIIGLSFQFICEITLLIFVIDWDKCAELAYEENQVEAEEVL